MIDRQAVLDALDTVLDPCSRAAGRPLSVVGMGLVEDVAIDAGSVRVTLVLTDPLCAFYVSLCDGVRAAVQSVPEVRDVTVEVDGGVLWVPSRMRQGRSMLPLVPIS